MAKQYNLRQVFNYVKWRDIFHLFVAALVFPFAIVAKIFIRDFWLICEEENEARDNGYWLFKWMRENKPEQKAAYAINKKSSDYGKVKDLGKVIGYGSISHWFWYIVADKNISSQKGGKPNAAVCYLFEVVLGLRRKNRVFLQHGVIVNQLDWLFYKNTYIRLFITSALQEHDYIVDKFGYPNGYVQLCGLARFDNLHTDVDVNKDLILVMPSWRNWLGREAKDNRGSEFTDTEYYKRWHEFLSSERLDKMLEKYGKKMIFYPHRHMQKFLPHFAASSKNIVTADWKNYDIQDLLKRSALMITDYSSVFFDFSYMKKPVIFYQFDEAEFRAKQYGAGYFDYKNTALGKWTDNVGDLLDVLEERLSGGDMSIGEDTIRRFFAVYDDKNSERNYSAIKKI